MNWLRGHNGHGARATSAVIACLLPAAALGAELPAALAGSWSNQADAPSANPARLVLNDAGVTIDGKPCTLDSVRAQHASRWYADLTCGTDRVWLDINLIGADRILVSRRPLGEADIYLRRTTGMSEGRKK